MKKFIIIAAMLLLVLTGCKGKNDGLGGETADLKDEFPEYYGLDASGGLDVVVWQMAPELYSFALCEHKESRSSIELLQMRLKGADAGQMKTILSSYNVKKDGITVVVWQNPVSSYVPDCYINYGGNEDMEAKQKAYVENIKKMLFE